MLFDSLATRVAPKMKPSQVSRYVRPYSTNRISKPLRILFCGSDEFSCASLQALHAERQAAPEYIRSIDVLCRPGKLSGRSMTRIREVPLKAVARELGLSIHERDTFTGWNLPKPEGEAINLIVAVSFGLFVPPRILKSAEYGGLNVHPSLLPRYRGPAPLQHTIMNGDKYTGVTLQTLHETSFDNGVILDQTPYPGLAISSPNEVNYSKLLDFVTPVAAAMLARGIRNRIHVPPHIPPQHFTHASRITPKDREVDWENASAIQIEQRFRALGRLWSNLWVTQQTPTRVIFEDFELLGPDFVFDERPDNGSTGGTDALQFAIYTSSQGVQKPLFFVEDGDAIIIQCKHQFLRVREITVEGSGKKPAAKAMQGLYVRSAGKAERE